MTIADERRTQSAKENECLMSEVHFCTGDETACVYGAEDGQKQNKTRRIAECVPDAQPSACSHPSRPRGLAVSRDRTQSWAPASMIRTPVHAMRSSKSSKKNTRQPLSLSLSLSLSLCDSEDDSLLSLSSVHCSVCAHTTTSLVQDTNGISDAPWSSATQMSLSLTCPVHYAPAAHSCFATCDSPHTFPTPSFSLPLFPFPIHSSSSTPTHTFHSLSLIVSLSRLPRPLNSSSTRSQASHTPSPLVFF